MNFSAESWNSYQLIFLKIYISNILEALIVRKTEMLNFTLSKNFTCIVMVLYTLSTTTFTEDKTNNSIPYSPDVPWNTQRRLYIVIYMPINSRNLCLPHSPAVAWIPAPHGRYLRWWPQCGCWGAWQTWWSPPRSAGPTRGSGPG